MKINGGLGASCIVFCEDKVLLAKHIYEPAKGKYFVPGGYLKQGEMLEQTAVREVFEETSINIEITGILHIQFAPESIWVIFLADYISGTPTSDNNENDSVLFMSVQEASEFAYVSNTTKEFIKNAIDKNKKVFTLSEYVSINNPNITRDNWHLYE